MTHGINGNDPARRRGRNRKRIEPAQAESLFDSQGTPSDGGAEGRRRRDEGAKRAEHGSTAVHRRAGERALRELAGTGLEFTSDDLHERLNVTLPHGLTGALILAASKRGEIKATGFTQSTRPEAHGRYVRTWRGTGGAA